MLETMKDAILNGSSMEIGELSEGITNGRQTANLDGEKGKEYG